MSQIDTARLQLRSPLMDADPRHIEWLNDKSLMRWSEQRWRKHDYESQDQFLRTALFRENPICFDIRLQSNTPLPIDLQFKGGETIGTIHAYLDKRHRRADIGIMLGPQYHGKGYATEAWRAVEEYLHQEHGIRKFEAGCASGNMAMKQLLLKCGYEEEGIRFNHFVIDAQPYALFLYGKIVP